MRCHELIESALTAIPICTSSERGKLHYFATEQMTVFSNKNAAPNLQDLFGSSHSKAAQLFLRSIL